MSPRPGPDTPNRIRPARLCLALALGCGAPSQGDADARLAREAWVERASAMVDGMGRIDPRRVAEAWAHLEASSPLATATLVQQHRYRIARALLPFAGREVAEDTRIPGGVDLALQALRSAQASGEPALEADAWVLLGDAHLRASALAEARAAYDRAVALAAGGDEAVHSSQSLAHSRSGMLAAQDGDYEAWRHHLDAAVQLAPEAATFAPIRGTLHGALGEFHLAAGQFTEAAAAFAAEAAELGATAQTARLHELDLWLATERFEDVVAAAPPWIAAASNAATQQELQLRMATAMARIPSERSAGRDLLDSLQQPGSAVAGRARVARAGLALDDGDLGTARALLAGPPPGGGLVTRTKALLLRARLAFAGEGEVTAALESELETSVNQLLAQWDVLDAPPDGIGFLQYGIRRDLLSALMTARIRRHADGAQRALADLLRAQDRGSFARRQGLPASDTSAALALAPERGAALVWLPATVGSHLFVLERSGIHHFDVGDDRPLRALGQRFRRMVVEADTDPAALEAVGRALRDGLLPPAAGKLVDARHDLLIVGVGCWGSLPIEALPGSTERFFGWTHAISHVPSVAVGHWLAQRTVPPTVDRTLLAWAPRPYPATAQTYGLDELDVDRTQVERMFSSWRGDAMRSAPLEIDTLDAAPPDYLVLLGHGVFAPGRAAPTGIAIGSEPGVLWSDALARGRAAPITAILSCGAGRSPHRRGEDGGNGMAVALFAAGARLVVLAEEDLELASTLAIMEAMHTALAEGDCSVAEALRRARLAVGARPGFEAAAFHSLLSVHGPSHNVVRGPAAPRPWWPWIAAAGAVALVFYVGRRRASAPTAR